MRVGDVGRKINADELSFEELQDIFIDDEKNQIDDRFQYKISDMNWAYIYVENDPRQYKFTWLPMERKLTLYSAELKECAEYRKNMEGRHIDFSERPYAAVTYPEKNLIQFGEYQLYCSEDAGYNLYLILFQYADYYYDQGITLKETSFDPVTEAEPFEPNESLLRSYENYFLTGNERIVIPHVMVRVYGHYSPCLIRYYGEAEFQIAEDMIEKYEWKTLNQLMTADTEKQKYLLPHIYGEKPEHKYSLYYDTYWQTMIIGLASENIPSLHVLPDQNRIFYVLNSDINPYQFCEIVPDTRQDYETLVYWFTLIIRAKEQAKNKTLPLPGGEGIREEAETAWEIEEEFEKDPLEELNEMIGLSSVKKQVIDRIGVVKAAKMREIHGLSAISISNHMVFTGNPGTGKTSVARILGRIYKQIGLLKKGHVVEVDRSDLVGNYIGETAIKTKGRIKEAYGGILFIDEAYSLSRDDYGHEAIDTLLKAMEDKRDKFIVIAAGYGNEMESFINMNPGLKSRFNTFIHFPDYTAEDLLEIFDLMCRNYDYRILADARRSVAGYIDEILNAKNNNFANAREIRNYFEAIITKQALRICQSEDMENEDYMTITQEDIETEDYMALWEEEDNDIDGDFDHDEESDFRWIVGL